jgi:glycosyltransferase involved in cell wall biosynthesis
MSTYKISIIIRTYNESKWLSILLKAIKQQTLSVYEIIVIDSGSNDGTKEILKELYPEVILLDYQGEKYLPGKAINQGIKASSGEIICILSAHCIPVHNEWLENMVNDLADNNNCAGVYSRQIPLSFSSNQALRDMSVIYSSESRWQFTDSYFNNASSIIWRRRWEDIEFDNNITNIEDRIWAAQQQEKGYCIRYCSTSLVHHYHGPHHNNHKDRLKSTVKTLNKYGSLIGLTSGTLGIKKESLIPIYFTKSKILNDKIKMKLSKLLSTYQKVILISSCELLDCYKSDDRVKGIIRDANEVYRELHLEKSIAFYKLEIVKLIKGHEYIVIYDDSHKSNTIIDANKYLEKINHHHYDIIYPVEKIIQPILKRVENESDYERVDMGNFPKKDMQGMYLVLRGDGTIIHVSKIFQKNILIGTTGIVVL